MKRLLTTLLLALASLSTAGAQVPPFPASLPPNTVIGRISPVPGPATAIPITTLLSQVTTVGTVTSGVWNGTPVDLAHGGTNANLTASAGGIFYSTGSAAAILAGTVTAGQCLLSGSSAAPTWGACAGGGGSGTVNAGTAGQLGYYATSTTAISGLSTGTIISSPTLTGNWTFTPASGNAITVNIVGGTPTTLGVNITSALSGAASAGTQQAANSFILNDSTTDVTGSMVTLQGGYVANATTSNGNGVGVLGTASQSANTNVFYGFGVQGLCQATKTASGPTGLGGAGQCAGLNANGQLLAGATGYLSVFGMEVDTTVVAALAGASAPKFKAGIDISHNALDAVRGATYDAALAISSNSGSAVGWKYGVLFSKANGVTPFTTSSIVIGALDGPQQVTSFIDFSTYTCTGSYINFTNFVADCSGNTQILNTSAFGWVGNFSRISSPGDGVILLADHTVNAGFGRLQFGGTTASFPSIKRNGTALNFRLADDSSDAPITAALGTHTVSSIGATPTDGVVLQNTVAANAGAQQFSPRIRLTGQGWRTNGGGASETVDWTIDNRPVQSAADPFTALVFSMQQNAGGYSAHTAFVLGSSSGSPPIPADSNQRFIMSSNSLGTSIYGVDNAGLVYAWCNTCSGTLFGTAVNAPTDFWSNNVRRLRIAGNATHISYWNNTTANQTANTPPVLSACGTGPAISSISSDASGTVTMGTGTPAGCVITFAVAYVNAPICRVSWRINIASMQYAVSTTAITLTQTATSSNVIDYACDGS